MNQEDPLVRTTLRIPGNWSHPGELVERLPAGFRLTPEALLLPDHTEIEFTPMPPDDQFADIFRSSCRQPAADDELEIVDSYTVNVVLTGPGGSLTAALTTLRAGAAIVRAGGAGVFIDNSGVAHGGRRWIEMAEDGGPDAVSFAFVGIVRGRQEVWTVGMHVMGLPDIVMRRSDAGADGDDHHRRYPVSLPRWPTARRRSRAGRRRRPAVSRRGDRRQQPRGRRKSDA